MRFAQIAAGPSLRRPLTRTLSRLFFAGMRRCPLAYGTAGRYLAICEFVLLVALGFVSNVIYHFVIADGFGYAEGFVVVEFGAAGLYCLGMQAQHLYRPAAILHPRGTRPKILATWVCVFWTLTTLAFLAKISGTFSRGAIVSYFACGAAALPLVRASASRILARAIAQNVMVGRRRILLFGDREQLRSRNVAYQLGRHGYKICGQIDFGLEMGNNFDCARKIETGIHRLRAFLHENRIDEIFLVFATAEQRAIDVATQRMTQFPIPVRLLLDRGLSRFLSQPALDLGAGTAIKLQSGPLTENQQLAKRLLDIVVASIGLFVLAPVMLLIAACIKQDSPGPVLFKQRRAGFSGRTFLIYKFRSMATLDDGEVVKQAVRGDQRVTKVGRFLRKASLDELPQLINVLKGEMSIVGPRPHALSHDNQYDKIIATYALRHHMKPGITGWAQVNGCRGETADVAAMAARVDHDLWYIVHWKLLLDVRVILMTVLQVFWTRDVY